jgi:hypothetical protein
VILLKSALERSERKKQDREESAFSYGIRETKEEREFETLFSKGFDSSRGIRIGFIREREQKRLSTRSSLNNNNNLKAEVIRKRWLFLSLCSAFKKKKTG